MDLFEYQGKELFAAAGIAVPRSRLARSVAEAERAAAEVGYPAGRQGPGAQPAAAARPAACASCVDPTSCAPPPPRSSA